MLVELKVVEVVLLEPSLVLLNLRTLLQDFLFVRIFFFEWFLSYFFLLSSFYILFCVCLLVECSNGKKTILQLEKFFSIAAFNDETCIKQNIKRRKKKKIRKKPLEKKIRTKWKSWRSVRRFNRTRLSCGRKTSTISSSTSIKEKAKRKKISKRLYKFFSFIFFCISYGNFHISWKFEIVFVTKKKEENSTHK